MADPTHTYTRLPGKLQEELGISRNEYDGSRKSRNGPGRRKEQRKAARVEKKTKHVPTKRAAPGGGIPITASERECSTIVVKQPPVKSTSVQTKPIKSILKASKHQPIPSPPSSPPPKIARHVKDKLVKDDAEIAALEKALGVKASSKLPKSFEDDGLDELIEGLDGDVDALEARLGNRKKPEGYDWLEKKRRKMQAAVETEEISTNEGIFDQDVVEEGDSLDGSQDSGISDNDSGEENMTISEDLNEIGGEDEDGSDLEPSKATRQPKENPYVAPSMTANNITFAKYVPPSLRKSGPSQSEDLSRLRKQIQGLLNRLSEANMLSIVGEIEKLYQTNPRQHVSATILDVLLALLSDPSSLQDTFMILHAGLIAALFKTVGTEFGAQAIQRINAEFSHYYEIYNDRDMVDKRLLNLINVIAELYNFQVISSALIYDLIRQFLTELSETNTQLLLKIFRLAGPQLRQDDPSSLKAIVQLLQHQMTKTGEQAISTKIKFMMETMNDLKNNRLKTGIAASSISSEHIIRMKKTLGTLNQKRIKASEPLRIRLKDLHESDRRGKWWLVGSSYKDEGQDDVIQEANGWREKHDEIEGVSLQGDAAGELLQLAKEQRMNTSVRQSIFIAIMSATDYNDAYLRLKKFRLKKSQELEIPKVLIHCAKSEKVYNPFYTLLARKICSDRKLRMAFQFSLWDLFKQMDEAEEETVDENDREEDNLSLRAVVNLARMFGGLIAEGGLGLGVLKNLNLGYLQPKTRIFIEILLVTTILQSQTAAGGARHEASVREIFLKPKEMPEMARGLRWFLKKTVSKSDIAGSEEDKEVIKWGCKIARSALKGVMSEMLYDV